MFASTEAFDSSKTLRVDRLSIAIMVLMLPQAAGELEGELQRRIAFASLPDAG